MPVSYEVDLPDTADLTLKFSQESARLLIRRDLTLNFDVDIDQLIELVVVEIFMIHTMYIEILIYCITLHIHCIAHIRHILHSSILCDRSGIGNVIDIVTAVDFRASQCLRRLSPQENLCLQRAQLHKD